MNLIHLHASNRINKTVEYLISDTPKTTLSVPSILVEVILTRILVALEHGDVETSKISVHIPSLQEDKGIKTVVQLGL